MLTEQSVSCNPTSRVVPFLVTKGSESGVSSLTEKAVSVGSPPASLEGTLQPGSGAAKQDNVRHIAVARPDDGFVSRENLKIAMPNLPSIHRAKVDRN